MEFAFKVHDGHAGARKFWRIHLPRLKYHNPGVSMTVNRSNDNSGPSTMTVFFASVPEPTSATNISPAHSVSESPLTATPEVPPIERIESINMKHYHESEILEQLMRVTKATSVLATAEDEAELQALEEQKQRGEVDRERMAEVNERRKREKRLLEQARGGLAAARAA